jgi:hypothetical protein
MNHLLSPLALVLVLTSSLGAADPVAPPPPAEYRVLFRYGLPSSRNPHVAQFDAMMTYLKSIGLKLELPPDADAEFLREDASVNWLVGTIPSGQARKMLTEPHVRSLLLLPASAKLPEGMNPVRIQMELRGGMTIRNQQLQAAQALALLQAFGFREAAGYDHRGHTRLVGTLPANQLLALVADVRLLPPGIKYLKNFIAKDAGTYAAIAETLDYLLDELRGEQNGPAVLRTLLIDLKRHKADEDFPYDLLVRLMDQLAADIKRFPAGADTLEAVLIQLQNQPAGRDLVESLFSRLRRPAVGVDLPLLYRSTSPIQITEAFPDVPAAKDAAAEAIPKELENLSLTPELRALLASKAAAGKLVRLEAILTSTPPDHDRSWLRGFPGLVVEGRAGPLVTFLATPEQVPVIASQPYISTVRLPRSGQPRALSGPASNDPGFDPLKASGVSRLHAMGSKGQGIRVAVIDGDFRGWQALTGKQLPAKTRLVDMTTERNPTLQPDPFAGDAQGLGHGTQIALALMRAAPQAELTLIRVDPSSPYQLLDVARAISGDVISSPSLDRRGEEIEETLQNLKLEKAKLLEERALVLDDFSQEDESVKRRADFFKKQAEFDKKERALHDLEKRYLQFRADLRSLRGTRIVANSLSWPEGHPVNGSSPISRFFDDRPFQAALWFQAAGDTHGQAWSGLFRDTDGNQVMEFAEPGAPLPKGRWSSELNFLAWDPMRGPQVPDLPAKATVRVSIQWSEVHDPDLAKNGEDPFRAPLAKLRLVVLRQRDPSGQKLATDDLEVVAASAGLPQRLLNHEDYAVYEQTVEFTADAAGRYALRVEGEAPRGTRPPSAPTLPGDRQGELRPRIFLSTLAGDGRAVFADFATKEGEFGVPGDAHQVISIGAANAAGQRQPFSAAGTPWNMELFGRPSFLAFDEVGTAGQGGAFGSSLANGFAAGVAASALSGGGPKARLFESLQVQPGEVLRVPPSWPRRGNRASTQR